MTEGNPSEVQPPVQPPETQQPEGQQPEEQQPNTPEQTIPPAETSENPQNTVEPQEAVQEQPAPVEAQPDAVSSAIRQIVDGLSPELRETFVAAPAEGKSFLTKIYEGSGLSTVVGKLQISYNQFWMNKHEDKANGLKGELNDFDKAIAAIDVSRTEIESANNELSASLKVPGFKSLQTSLHDMDEKKLELLAKKDRVQSNLEEVDNKMKTRTNERDRIADKLIGDFDEKLRPIEGELETLMNRRDQLDLCCEVTEAKHEGCLRKFAEIEKSKARLEEGLRLGGRPDKEIKKLVKPFEDILAQGRAGIRAEKELIEKNKKEINEKIAEADARANPYRDERDEFKRVKGIRPNKIEIPVRKNIRTEYGSSEVVSPSTRVEEEVNAPVNANESAVATAPESVEQREVLPTVSLLVSHWNEYLKTAPGSTSEKIAKETINLAAFLKAVPFRDNFELSLERFKKILGRYYKVKKITTNNINDKFDKFVDTKRATQNTATTQA